MFGRDDFMQYQGYRSMVKEEKTRELEDQIRSGRTSVSVDRGDLTDSEAEEVRREAEKRTGAHLR